MWVGDVVAERFVIVRPIGSGGMGSVFLAEDRTEGRQVALKVLDLATEGAVERFRLEARVLSGLSHPGIVRYVSHGETNTRQPFLAMELLEGEDLAQRLARGGLTVDETVGVVRQVASALACAHGQGIVHRDVKPSNLFLAGGDVDRVKVLDFGLARMDLQTLRLTQTGAMLGTVGYMAPEQAMGRREVEPAADVFALGCVLFECLTGQPAFAGAHPVAVLAKVLSEEAPRLGELRPELSPFGTLVGKMLSKDPSARPPDADAVLVLLDQLDDAVASSPEISSSPRSLTGSERRVVNVVLAEPAGDARVTELTLSTDQAEAETDRVRELTKRFDATFWPLRGGGLLFVLSGRRAATDQAALAASFALELGRIRDDLRIALATGRAETTRTLPVGPAIDRAAALLRERRPGGGTLGVAVDDVTVGLIGSRFDVEAEGAVHYLARQRADFHAPRPLLGKVTPCLGREKELGLLTLTLDECITDSVPRAVLVTAPPGTGKSRLAGEFMSRIHGPSRARVLLARAEAVTAGSALALARKLIRRAAGVRDGDPPETQQAGLREYGSVLAPSGGAERLAEFLGEIIGAPVAEPVDPILRAARADPAILREQKRRAFAEWIEAETRTPLVIVLEDIHWGDKPTATFLEEALRTLRDRPLMVLALGRPEVHDELPGLWGGPGGDLALQEVRLGGLTRRAAERLVRLVLGGDADSRQVSGVVDRADGNAFYLEELIREAARGETDFPETVLAMAEARLAGVEAPARRVLRAASVFGEAFWPGGVAALVGATAPAADWLETLADREFIVRAPESRFTGEREYVFRHALLRDAAYAMLTDEDRRVAHRLAAGWLAGAGEKDPLVLGEHLEQGGDFAGAVPHLIRAADAAFNGGNAEVARNLAVRGAAYAKGESLGVLRAIEAASARIQADPAGEMLAVRQALALLPAGGRHWLAALSGLAYRASVTGDPAATQEVARALASPLPMAAPDLVQALSTRYLVLAMLLIGQPEVAASLVGQIEAVGKQHPDHDAQFAGWLSLARSHFDFYRPTGSPGAALRDAHAAVARFEEAGNPVATSHARYWTGICLLSLGQLAPGQAALEATLAAAEACGNRFIIPLATMGLAWAHAHAGRTEQAGAALGALVSHADPYISGHGNAVFAEVRLLAGDHRAAEAHAVEAMRRAPGAHDLRLLALHVLAAAVLADGRPGAALEHVEPVLTARSGAWCGTLTACQLTRVRALEAMGDGKAARARLREARERILRTAETLDDAKLRAAFLGAEGATRETMRLAEEWLG